MRTLFIIIVITLTTFFLTHLDISTDKMHSSISKRYEAINAIN